MADNSRRFVLRAFCPNEWLEGFDYFVVDITPEYARVLLDRIRFLKSVKEQDSDAYEIYFWDASGDYFGGDPDEHDDQREPSLTECNQLVVQETEVKWTAIPKHSDIFVTTDYIRAGQLAEVAVACRGSGAR